MDMQGLVSKVLRNLKDIERIFIQTMHHSIDPKNFDGWHYRTATAIKRYTGYESILINPAPVDNPELRVINGFNLILVPYMDLNKLPLHRWGHVSPSWVKLARLLIKGLRKRGHKVYIFIHAPRAFNSILLFRGIADLDAPIIMQHHGEKNYYYYFLKALQEGIRNPVKLVDYYLMHLIDCSMARDSKIVYSLAGYDVHYYREVCGARSRISTMGVFFEDLKPLKNKCCGKIKRIIYVGGVRRGDWKGSDILIRIYKALGGRRSGYELIIVGPIEDPDLYRIGKECGVVFTGKLKEHSEVINLVNESDAYIITARTSYYWGGPGVAIMEAMALNVPVVSPTLSHVPSPDREGLGIRIPWADSLPFEELVRIVRSSLEALEGFELRPREVAEKYFSWRSIVRGYIRDLGL